MKLVTLPVSLLILSTMTSAQQPFVEYKLGMSKPHTHLLEVEVAFENLPSNDKELDLILPVWRSGRYVLFDFAGGVQEFSAVDGTNKPLDWTKVDKSTWRIQKQGATAVTARYKVYANEFNQRTRGLNDEHAFVDPMSAFMYVEKYRRLPLTLTVVPYGSWHITTGLDAIKGERPKFTAPNYDYFLDCPLEVGNQKDFEFEVEGKKHVLMIYGSGNYDFDAMIRDISKLVTANKEFWGRLPYERYVFMLHVTPSAGGGTEHINSTIMGSKPFIFKNPDAYRGFLGLVSHEYFHTWNVKQLRPSGIHPYDPTRENYLKELWIAEGTTDYYGSLLLVRYGFKPAQKYLDEEIAGAAYRDRLRPGNKIQSLSECSFDAWIKFWRNTEQSFNSETDYYVKGSDVSLLLDLEIRQRTKNKHSLDEVMKAMFERFRLGEKGYTVDDFQKVAEEFSGGSLKQFFDDYVHGTKPLEWEKYLGYAGLELTPKDTVMKPWLGLLTSDVAEKTRVIRVVAGSPAYEAGLDVNDEVLAIDGVRARTADLQGRVSEMKAGDRMKLTVFRDERLREFEVTLRNQEIASYKITKTKNPSGLQKAIYEGWLKQNWEKSEEELKR